VIKEFDVDVIDNPTTGQFLDVLNLIGLTEAQFRADPEKALTQAKNLSLEECQVLLDIISKPKINLREQSLDTARHIVGISTAFFLTSSLMSITKQQLTEKGFTNPATFRLGNRAERIAALMLLSQDLNRHSMPKFADGN